MFTLTLDGRSSLKKEIRAMRRQRLSATDDYVWNITLQQRTGPILYVRAKSHNLWVEEYSTDNSTWHKFENIHPDFSMNYEEGDSGCMLDATTITGLIKGFAELVNAGPLDYATKRQTIRNAFVMIIYVSSEMIKNEILEKAMDVTTYERSSEQKRYRWSELKFLYKNFSTLSTKLHKGDGKYYPTIYINDFIVMYVRLIGDPDAEAALAVINELTKPKQDASAPSN